MSCSGVQINVSLQIVGISLTAGLNTGSGSANRARYCAAVCATSELSCAETASLPGTETISGL